MTDVSDYITALSLGTVTIGTPGTISSANYAILGAIALEQATADNPGWSAAQLLEAQALYVLHLATQGQGGAGITSERFGDYSYTKAAPVSGSTWLDAYNALIAKVETGSVPEEGVLRCDSDMTGLTLDDGYVPTFGEEGLDDLSSLL